MQIIHEKTETNGAVLTGYIQSPSLEMLHLNSCPAVFILPGGLFQYCSEKEMEPIAMFYVQQGFNAFTLAYTTAETVGEDQVFEAAYKDAQEGLAYLRRNAAKLHINPKNIAAVGFSNGAGLAAALGTKAEDKPDALVLGYPILHSEKREAMELIMPDFSQHISQATPPAFLFAPQDDAVVSPAGILKFALALEEKKVTYENHIFSKGAHGLQETADWLTRSAEFLKHVWTKAPENEKRVEYKIEMSIRQLMSNTESAALLSKHLPMLRNMIGAEPIAAEMSVKKLAEYSGGMIPEEKVKALDAALKKLNETAKKEYPKQTAIYPGKVWLDTKGERIQAHGGAIFYENGTYYWYGENKEKTDGKNGIWTWGIRAYSSKDLYNWEDLGLIIPPNTEDSSSSLYPQKRVDRPHILKSPETGKYVCWIKLSGEEACFAILSADRFLGPYRMEKNEYYPLGQKVGDFDLVEDGEQGKAYLYMDSNHAGIVCMELTRDYLSVKGEVSRQYEGLHAPFCREAPAVFERHGKVYLLTSGMTGYIPNPSDSAVSDSYQNPFTSMGNPHVNDASKASFNSQISKVFKVPGKKDLYIALADRWVPEYVVDEKRSDLIMRGIASRYEPEKYQISQEEQRELMDSPMLASADTSIADYVWLPLRFEGNKVLIDWREEWKLEEFE